MSLFSLFFKNVVFVVFGVFGVFGVFVVFVIFFVFFVFVVFVVFDVLHHCKQKPSCVLCAFVSWMFNAGLRCSTSLLAIFGSFLL